MNNSLIRLERRAIRKDITNVVHRREFDNLSERVKELEEMLAMPPEKAA